MIETVKFNNKDYPIHQSLGNGTQFAEPYAKYYCNGIGYDIGCKKKEWSLNGSIPIDISFPDGFHALNLPLKEKVDYIYSSHCLEHIPNWVDVLDYWYDSLKEGGVLFLYLPHYDQEYWRPWNDKKHCNIFTPKIIKDWMKHKGFIKIFNSKMDLNGGFMIVGEKKENRMRKINFYSQEHLGDNMYHFHYCRHLLEKNKDIEIDYYMAPPTDCKNFEVFYNELKLHIRDLDRFNFIRDFRSLPSDILNMHINAAQTGNLYYPFLEKNKSYNDFYIYFFEHMSKLLNIDNPIKTNDDFLMDNPFILENNRLYNDKFDVLVINSMPGSGQVERILEPFDILFEYFLSKNYKVISTEKTKYPEVLSTVENQLSLLEIGNLSLNCDYVIGVHTSPMIYTFNKWNIDKIKKWILFQINGVTYTFNDRVTNFTTLNDMYKIKELL